jgi:hypothetical protein
MTEIPFEPFPDLCTVLPLTLLRKTKGVTFDTIPTDLIKLASGGERVIHSKGAVSPGAVGDVERPWYCHSFQDDHLLVLAGDRTVDLFHPNYNKIVTFFVSADKIMVDGKLLFDGGAILRWKAGVYHRIISSAELGSSSFNFSVRREGFDIRREFDIHSLDTATAESRVIRKGFLDQK